MNVRAWGVLFVLSGAIFLEGIDVAMLNVALPAIREDLGLSTGMLSGVVSAYVLGYGGFMLLGGRAADLLGKRRMFLLWLTVFLVFSGLGGLATEIEARIEMAQLVAGWHHAKLDGPGCLQLAFGLGRRDAFLDERVAQSLPLHPGKRKQAHRDSSHCPAADEHRPCRVKQGRSPREREPTANGDRHENGRQEDSIGPAEERIAQRQQC